MQNTQYDGEKRAPEADHHTSQRNTTRDGTRPSRIDLDIPSVTQPLSLSPLSERDEPNIQNPPPAVFQRTMPIQQPLVLDFHNGSSTSATMPAQHTEQASPHSLASLPHDRRQSSTPLNGSNTVILNLNNDSEHNQFLDSTLKGLGVSAPSLVYPELAAFSESGRRASAAAAAAAVPTNIAAKTSSRSETPAANMLDGAAVAALSSSSRPNLLDSNPVHGKPPKSSSSGSLNNHNSTSSGSKYSSFIDRIKSASSLSISRRQSTAAATVPGFRYENMNSPNVAADVYYTSDRAPGSGGFGGGNALAVPAAIVAPVPGTLDPWSKSPSNEATPKKNRRRRKESNASLQPLTDAALGSSQLPKTHLKTAEISQEKEQDEASTPVNAAQQKRKSLEPNSHYFGATQTSLTPSLESPRSRSAPLVSAVGSAPPVINIEFPRLSFRSSSIYSSDSRDSLSPPQDVLDMPPNLHIARSDSVRSNSSDLESFRIARAQQQQQEQLHQKPNGWPIAETEKNGVVSRSPSLPYIVSATNNGPPRISFNITRTSGFFGEYLDTTAPATPMQVPALVAPPLMMQHGTGTTDSESNNSSSGYSGLNVAFMEEYGPIISRFNNYSGHSVASPRLSATSLSTPVSRRPSHNSEYATPMTRLNSPYLAGGVATARSFELPPPVPPLTVPTSGSSPGSTSPAHVPETRLFAQLSNSSPSVSLAHLHSNESSKAPLQLATKSKNPFQLPPLQFAPTSFGQNTSPQVLAVTQTVYSDQPLLPPKLHTHSLKSSPPRSIRLEGSDSDSGVELRQHRDTGSSHSVASMKTARSRPAGTPVGLTVQDYGHLLPTNFADTNGHSSSESVVYDINSNGRSVPPIKSRRSFSRDGGANGGGGGMSRMASFVTANYGDWSAEDVSSLAHTDYQSAVSLGSFDYYDPYRGSRESSVSPVPPIPREYLEEGMGRAVGGQNGTATELAVSRSRDDSNSSSTALVTPTGVAPTLDPFVRGARPEQSPAQHPLAAASLPLPVSRSSTASNPSSGTQTHINASNMSIVTSSSRDTHSSGYPAAAPATPATAPQVPGSQPTTPLIPQQTQASVTTPQQQYLYSTPVHLTPEGFVSASSPSVLSNLSDTAPRFKTLNTVSVSEDESVSHFDDEESQQNPRAQHSSAAGGSVGSRVSTSSTDMNSILKLSPQQQQQLKQLQNRAQHPQASPSIRPLSFSEQSSGSVLSSDSGSEILHKSLADPHPNDHDQHPQSSVLAAISASAMARPPQHNMARGATTPTPRRTAGVPPIDTDFAARAAPVSKSASAPLQALQQESETSVSSRNLDSAKHYPDTVEVTSVTPVESEQASIVDAGNWSTVDSEPGRYAGDLAAELGPRASLKRSAAAAYNVQQQQNRNLRRKVSGDSVSSVSSATRHGLHHQVSLTRRASRPALPAPLQQNTRASSTTSFFSSAEGDGDGGGGADATATSGFGSSVPSLPPLPSDISESELAAVTAPRSARAPPPSGLRSSQDPQPLSGQPHAGDGGGHGDDGARHVHAVQQQQQPHAAAVQQPSDKHRAADGGPSPPITAGSRASSPGSLSEEEEEGSVGGQLSERRASLVHRYSVASLLSQGAGAPTTTAARGSVAAGLYYAAATNGGSSASSSSYSVGAAATRPTTTAVPGALNSALQHHHHGSSSKAGPGHAAVSSGARNSTGSLASVYTTAQAPPPPGTLGLHAPGFYSTRSGLGDSEHAWKRLSVDSVARAFGSPSSVHSGSTTGGPPPTTPPPPLPRVPRGGGGSTSASSSTSSVHRAGRRPRRALSREAMRHINATRKLPQTPPGGAPAPGSPAPSAASFASSSPGDLQQHAPPQHSAPSSASPSSSSQPSSSSSSCASSSSSASLPLGSPTPAQSKRFGTASPAAAAAAASAAAASAASAASASASFLTPCNTPPTPDSAVYGPHSRSAGSSSAGSAPRQSQSQGQGHGPAHAAHSPGASSASLSPSLLSRDDPPSPRPPVAAVSPPPQAQMHTPQQQLLPGMALRPQPQFHLFRLHEETEDEDDDGDAHPSSSSSSLRGHGGDPVAVYRVLRGYKPVLEDELELVSGDLLLVLHEFDDGWCFARLVSLHGRNPHSTATLEGVCPRSYISQTAQSIY